MSYDPTDCELGIEETTNMPTDDYYKKIDEQAAEVAKTPNSEGRSVWPRVDTIDLTPSWVSVVGIYLEVLMDSGAGTHAKEAAHSEIMRAAKLADLYVKEHKS